MKNLGSTDLKRLHREWRHRTAGRLGLVLDGVMTPVNVGSIARLAAAYGVERVWLAGATAPVGHPGAQRTAMGTDRYLDLVDGVTAVEAVDEAKVGGMQVVGIELAAGAVPLFDAPLARDVCLVVGHEEHGVTAACLERCDVVAFLPLVGKVGSLNVAMAAGIAVAEVRRREWTASDA
jgi:tRNA (guanosine-2'-O-)-methyltransferase